jgi:hypothetical protein
MKGSWNLVRDGSHCVKPIGFAASAVLVVLLVLVTTAGGTQPYETYEEAAATDAPVAQFRFNDASGSKAIEDSAGSYTATNSGIALGGEGPFGGSKSGTFGGEAYASLPSSPLIEASAFTVEGWLYWTGGTSYEQPLFDFGSSSTNYMFLTPAGGSKHLLLFEIRTGSTKDVQITAPKLTAKKWEYVAVTETSSGTLTLYVNGEQVAQTTGATLFPSSLGSVEGDYLGKSQVAGAPLFNGSMSNVAFYTKALSAERIKAHYDAGEYPVNTVAPAISGTVKDGSTLTAGKGTWTGLTPITYGYQWMLCNAVGEGCASIASATETKYVLGHEDVGDSLRVAVTGTNAEGSATATSAQTAVVAPLAPSNTVLPAISGEAKTGQLLSVTPGTWKGTPPISYGYQWQKCNSKGEACSNISGATTSSYRILNSQGGDTLRTAVTASNAAGSAKAYSAVTATITSGPPANTEPPTISGEAKEGQTLTASAGKWAGTEPFTYTYQWELCNAGGEGCTDITGATTSSYALGQGDVGGTLRVIVTAKDSIGSTEASSQPSTVVIGPPRNTAAPVISGTARDGQTLSASTGEWTGTQPVTYSYQWEGCNSAGESCTSITGAINSSYTVAHEQVGHTLRVVVTAKNGVGEARATSSATATVTASAPANTVPPAISGEAKDEQTLTASTGTWSGTTPLSYSYQWEHCDSLGESCLNISGATSSTYVLGHGDVGSTLRVVVTAGNSAGEASATSAATATVAAAAPTNTALPMISGEATDEMTLTASTGTWAGTPPISYTYQWESCNSSGGSCASISGATSSSYTIAHEQVGHTIRVTVTASNSAGEASATSAATATVAVAAPANTALPVISGEAKDGRTLSASTGAWNGTPPLTYAYQWQSCNSSGESCSDVSGETNSTYVLGYGDVGTTLRAIVTATNSVGSASSATEATAVVTAPGPTNITAPAISGTAQEGQTLTASEGTWEGTPPLTYAYQWQSCNGLGEGCLDVSGATSATYVLGPGEEGTTLRVLVTAMNSAGATSSTSQATEVVSTGSVSGLVYAAEFGLGGSGDGQFEHPADVAVDAKGDVWVLDRGNSRVEEFSQAGEYLRQFGSQGSGNGQLSRPDGLAVDSEGDVWVLDTGNERVEEFTEDGEFVRTVGVGMIGSAEGIAVDRHGDVWVSATYQGRLLVFANNGEYLKSVASHGSGAGQLGEPEGIAVDSDGDVWVADWANNRVEEFNEAGAYVRQFGSTGSGSGEISHPYGIAANNGHVFVGEIGNDRLQEFNEEGGFLSQIGTAGSEPGQLKLSYPIGLTINTAEDLWITDSGNDRVEEWKGGKLCTDNWIGPEEGSWETAADWSAGATPSASDVACLRRGVTVRVSSPGDQAASILGGGSLAIVGGSLSVTGSVPSGGASIHALRLDGGSLDITGLLSISGALTISGSPTVEGSGQLVVRGGATGSIGNGECSTHPVLSEVAFVNEGTLSFGGNSGAPDGAIAMANGAALFNRGTFNDESFDASCADAGNGYSFYDAGGAAPRIVNTGAFDASGGAEPIRLGVEISQQAGSLTIPEDDVLEALAPMSISGGTVNVGGRLNVQSFLETSGEATVTGPGPFVVARDATGTIGATPCSILTLDGASVTNEGTLTAPKGTVSMENDAQLDNPGTYIDNSIGYQRCGIADIIGTSSPRAGSLSSNSLSAGGLNTDSIGADGASADSVLGGGLEGYSFYDAGGAAPRIVNSGSVLINTYPRPGRVIIDVNLDLEGGALTVERGELETTEVLMTNNSPSINVQGEREVHGERELRAELEVQGTFTASSDPTISGEGAVLLASGATGTFGGGECSTPPVLSEVTFINEGTLTLGAPGGAADGAIAMRDGAEIHNKGTFYDDSYETGCGFAPAGYSLYDAGGVTPSVLNEGAFVADVAGTATNLGVPFGNDGSVEAQAGRFELSDGGLGEQVATGSWSAPGGQIALTGGEFLFAKEVDLSAAQEAGAVIEQELWNHVAQGIEGQAEEGQTLTAKTPDWTGTYAPSLRSPGGWTGQPVTFTYQWEECDGEEPGEIVGTECEPIEGATGSIYELEEEELGYTMRVTVTAHNQLGTTTSTSEATPVIEVPAFEVPEGEGEEEEGFGSLFVRRASLAYPSGEIGSHSGLYRNAETLYKDLAYFAFEVPSKHHEAYLYRKQIAGIMGNFVVESAYTLSPTQQEIDCEGERCGIGIAQWTKTERWHHVEEVGKEHPIRGKHGHLENGKYTMYVQALTVWDELKGRWEPYYEEALKALESENSEKPRGVTVGHATVLFTEKFEGLTEETVGEPGWHEHLEVTVPAAKEVFQLSAQW